MKFRFKIQQYQTDAVNAICDVFKGQPYQEHAKYTLDMGVVKPQMQSSLFDDPDMLRAMNEDYDVGFANPRIEISPETILGNIKDIQALANINES